MRSVLTGGVFKARSARPTLSGADADNSVMVGDRVPPARFTRSDLS
jgi:hypothetical protein